MSEMSKQDSDPRATRAPETDQSYLSCQFLIAMPGMMDPNFANGVTLMCQHNAEGAIGITINRPSQFTLLEVFPNCQK